MILNRIALVAAGGAIGAAGRYLVTLLAHRIFGAGLPWGTLAVNLIGCLLIGLAMGWTLDGRSGLSEPARLLLVTGLLGGLTTFSSFGLETVELLRAGRGLAGVGYALGSLLLGVAAAALGLAMSSGS